LSGLQNNRSVEDEQLCEYICKSTSQQAYIFDTRPKLNAIANRAQGKGYEDERFYKHAKVQFLPIDNIHVVRKSLENFIDAVENSKSFGDFYGNVEKSGWVGHLSSILASSITVADKVDKGSPCILHCSDGWDRTSQVGSLAQLLLDPFYRTIQGFLVLVNKDWLKFGHQMQHRLGHVNPVQYTSSHGAQNLEQEQSPIFAQWLEIIHQLVRLFPSEFEFNSNLLINTFYHATSCQFGTFLTNNDKDRSQILDKTYCYFEYVLANKTSMKNGEKFSPSSDFLKKVFLKNVEESWSLWEFWGEMYCQRELKGKDMVENCDADLNVRNKSVPEKKFMTESTENVKNSDCDDVVEISPESPKSHKSGKSNSSSPNKLAEELGYCTVKDDLVNIDDSESNNFDPLGVL
jgi:myotubularin-related protein 6/7/8